jgi:hypothetical protein
VRTKYLGAVLPVFETGEGVARIAGHREDPLHQLGRVVVVLVVGGAGREDREPGGPLEEVEPVGIEWAREERQ